MLAFCFVTLAANVFAAEENISPYWNRANNAYTRKQYDSAVFYYSKIAGLQTSNALVYYNLGNAYYKSNRIALAVLSYERALFYNPALDQAKDNLNLAKNRIPNALKQRQEIFFIRWWQSSTSGNTATAWAIISLLVFLGFIAIIFLSVHNTRKIPGQLFLLTPVLIFLLLFCSFTAAKNANSTRAAVTMNATTIMTIAPNEYKGQVIIPEATTVETGETKGNWIAVTLPDNREGWVQKAELSFVMPSIK